MANNSTPDVFLLLGVEGGSNIGKGSGLLISTQLKQIMEQVEETITSHLKIKLDQNALSELKTQINDTVTEALTSIKGTPVELTFSFNQDSIDKAFRDVKKQLKEQNITISAQPQEKKKQGGTGNAGSTNGSGSSSLGNVKKEAEESKQEIREVGKVAEKAADAVEDAVTKTKISEEQRLKLEKQITLELERQAFYASKKESFNKEYSPADDYTENDRTRLREVSHLYDRSKRINYYNSMPEWISAREKLSNSLDLDGGDLDIYQAEKKMVDVIHRQFSGVIEASAHVYATSLQSALSQITKDIKWEWANDVAQSFKEYDDRYAIIQNEDFITNTPYSHFIFNTSAVDSSNFNPDVDDIYTKVFKKKQEWYIQAVEFTESANNFYSAIDDINNQMKSLEDTLSSFRSFNSPSRTKFNSTTYEASLFGEYYKEMASAGKSGLYRETEHGYVADAPNTFSRQPEMWKQYESELKEYADYLDQYRDYIFDYASQVKQDAIDAFNSTGDVHEYQKILDDNKEHLESLTQNYIEEYNRYNDVLYKGTYVPEDFPLYTQFEDFANKVKPQLDVVEEKIEDVAAAEKEVIHNTQELESAVASITHDDVKYPLSTFVKSDFIKPALQAADYANKMQSLNSDTADEAIDRVTESIEAQNDALRENTDAIKDNQKAQAQGGRLREPAERISMSISEGANGRTVTTTSRGLNTGRIYKDTESTKIGKDGVEEITNAVTFGNSQINSMLDSIEKKLVVLREKRDQLLEINNSDNFIDKINTEIDETIYKSEQLVQAMNKAAETGYFGDLEKLGFSDIQSAESALQKNLRDINTGITNVRKEITEFNREQDKSISLLDNAHYGIEKLKSDLTELGKSDVTNVTEELQYGIQRSIDDTELLELALRDAILKGDTSLLNEFGINDINEGIRVLQDRIQNVNKDIKSGESTVSNTASTSVRLLTQATEQVDRLRHGLEKLDSTSPEEAATDIRQNITSAIVGANQLIAALKSASETGDLTDLQKAGYNTFTEGYNVLRNTIVEISDTLSDGKTEVSNYQKSWDSLSQTLSQAAAKKSIIKDSLANINSSQFDGGEVVVGMEAQLQNIERIYEVLQKYSDPKLSGNDRANFDWEHQIDGAHDLTSAINILINSISNLENSVKAVKNNSNFITDDAALSAIRKYNEALREFKATSGADKYTDLFELDEWDVDDINGAKSAIKKITVETQRLITTTTQLTKANREEQNVITQRNKIYQEAKNYYDKYQSGIRANIALNQKWQDTLKQLHDGGFGDNESARRALAELQTATKDANAETMTLWGSLKKLFTDHFGSVSATAFIGTLRNVLRGAYENVLEIDKAMTELRKVTELTEQQYESFQRRAADMAKEVGGSIADTILTVSDYSRLGYTLEQSESLGRAALVYKNVGDGIESIDEATESIISTLRAFNIEAEDSMQIIDVFNTLGNNLPISSGALGTALQKSASALAAANNTFSESAAMIAAANSVVQNEEVTGTALKTISMYLRAAKTEAEEAGIETEGMADSVSKLRQEILDLTDSKVDIILDDETFKSTYQIIKELSEVWNELSDITQANILEKIGGKRNANINAALIENFDIAIKAVELAEKANGSALAENEKFLDSIAGHINQLKVNYEDLSQTVIDSDLVKFGVDFLSGITGGLNDIIKNFGTLQTLIPIIAGSLSAFKDVGRDKTLSLMEYADCGAVVTRNELMAA